jgi:cathepsin D
MSSRSSSILPPTGASTRYSTGFEIDEFPPDGLAGLAFPSIAVFNANDIFTTLVDENQVSTAQFGFKLADSGSELFLGGVDENAFTGSFANSPVTQDVSAQGSHLRYGI